MSETPTQITGDDETARKRRQAAYDRWFHICTCGHGPESHDFDGQAKLPVAACKVQSCDCIAYDHISGKPDHPCNPLPAGDPRRDPAHPPALDPEPRERLERLVDYFRNTASGIVTANEGKPWDGCKDGETPASEAWWQAADTLDAALLNLSSHQGGGEELKAVRDFADERRDELNAARSTLDRSDQRYEANAGEARAFGSVVAFIDTLGRSHPEGQVE